MSFNQGKLDDAMKYYKEAIAFQKNYELPYMGLGLIYLEREDYPGALESFEKALKYKPNYFEAHSNIGLVYVKMKEFDKAKEAFRLTVQSSNPAVRSRGNYNLGLLYMEMKNYERAYFSFKKVVKDTPDYIPAYAKTATSLEKQGKNEEALPYYLKAFKLSPDNAEYTHALALLYFRLNRLDSARSYLKKTMAIAPNSEYGDKAFELLKMIPE